MLNNLINGISLGSVYAIIALGYTMVYGIAKMLNFAHGDVIMIGGYMAFCASSYLGWGYMPSILLAILVCTVLGIVIEKLAYKPLRSATSLAVLITAIGVSYFLQNAALLIWSSNPKVFPNMFANVPNINLGSIQIAGVSIVTILANIIIMIALTLFTGKTKVGKAMRAVSEDKGAAQLMGINVNSTISLTFAIGSGLAAKPKGKVRRELLYNEIVAYEMKLDFDTAKAKAESFAENYPEDEDGKLFLPQRVGVGIVLDGILGRHHAGFIVAATIAAVAEIVAQLVVELGIEIFLLHEFVLQLENLRLSLVAVNAQRIKFQEGIEFRNGIVSIRLVQTGFGRALIQSAACIIVSLLGILTMRVTLIIPLEGLCSTLIISAIIIGHSQQIEALLTLVGTLGHQNQVIEEFC